MKATIATVVKIEGNVSVVDSLGQKRELVLGECLYLDEVIKTAQLSSVQLQVGHSQSLELEALQSLKLSSDISPEHMSEQSDAVLNADLPMGLIEQLFSVYPLAESSILTQIEPVYDIERLKLNDYKVAEVSFQLSDILQNAHASECLDQYLRFDQNIENTVVYFSQIGSFSEPSSIEFNADKVLSINSVGYHNSAELLSFLLDNNLILDQS